MKKLNELTKDKLINLYINDRQSLNELFLKRKYRKFLEDIKRIER